MSDILKGLVESNLGIDDEKKKYIQAAKDVLKGADFDHLCRIRKLDPETLRKHVDYAWEKVNRGEYKLNRPNLDEVKRDELIGGIYDPDDFDDMVLRLKAKAKRQRLEKIADTLMNKIISAYPDVITNYGHEVVGDAILNVAEKFADKIQLEPNDTNVMIRQVMGSLDRNLKNLDEDLRKWFKEKWVRFGPDGKIRGACARGSDKEGKPKCLPQAKAHSLGKKGRKYAASKKRREDPNPERRGPAKNVATKKKSNEGVAEGSTGVSVRKWANQVRKDHGTDVKFWNRREGGGAVDSIVARNSQGETVGVYNRKTGYPTVFEPKQGVAEGYDKWGWHTSVVNGEFMPTKYGNKAYVYLHDLDNESPRGGPQLVTFNKPAHAKKAAAQFGGKVVKTDLNTYRIVKPAEQGVAEASPETTFNVLKGLKSWQVVIRNNYYNGKYPDYSGRYYYVLASSPEEAEQVVLDNADAILQDLLSMKSVNGKKILPRNSAVRITADRIGEIRDGTEAGRMSTAGFKKMFGPEGPMMVKLSNGAVADIQGREQGVAEGSGKLQGTPVVSLSDFDDKDTKKNKYGQTVPKKLKKDDPRVKFHKDPKQDVAEGIQNSFKIRCAGKTVKTDTYKKAQEQARQMADASGKDAYISGFRDSASTEEIVKPTKQGVAEEQLDELKCWPGYTRVRGVPAGAPGSCKKKTSEDVTEEKCPECGGPMFSEMIMNEKKDACYYKVKSRYKVWPSAYASGALVKCRKKGAKNWGTGGKKNESIEESMQMQDYLDKAEELHQRMLDASRKNDVEEFERLKKERDKLDALARQGMVPEGQIYSGGNKPAGMRWYKPRSVPNQNELSKKESAIMKGLQLEGNDEEYHTGGTLGTPYPGTYEQETLPYRTKGQRRTQAIAFEDEQLDEKWSDKYKRSIDCSNPKGFSQRAHCQGRKKK